MSTRFLNGLVLTTCVAVSATCVHGQTQALPDTARIVTPAENAYALYQMFPYYSNGPWAKADVRIQGARTSRLVIDSAQAVQAGRIVSSTRENDFVSGMQIDPLAQLYATAANDERARQLFEKRLATKGISAQDRAYSLLSAVQIFSQKGDDSVRMRRALEYLARLDAEPQAAIRRFQGHVAIANGYYSAGLGHETARHYAAALALVERIPFEERSLQWKMFGGILIRWADAVSGQPDGRARIDSMVAWLRPLTQAPAAPAGMQAGYAQMSLINPKILDAYAKMIEPLGRPAPPLTANYWHNTSAPKASSPIERDAQIKTLDDGKIRIVEVGHFGCGGCLMALPTMQRLHQSMPANVEVWMTSDESAYLGTKLVPPQEKVAFLADYYNKRGYRFPIAIFIGERDVTDPDIGLVQRKNPTAMQVPATPTFIITDGRGIVRHIGPGDDEEVLQAAIRFLVAEAAHAK